MVPESPQRRKLWSVLLGALCALVLAFLMVRYFVLMQVTVRDQGMFPILTQGDRVLVNRLAESYEVGDLVVFIVGDQYFVRRVVGAEGDRVEIKGGAVMLNSFPAELVERGELAYKARASGSTETRERVCERALESIGFASHEVCLGVGVDGRSMDAAVRPLFEGQFFVLCDNRADCSADSRELGPVLKGAVRGKVTHLMARADDRGATWRQKLLGLWEEL